MKLEFKGTVEVGDGWRQEHEDDTLIGAVHIGGSDIIDEIAEYKWTKNVRVTLNGNDVANGKLITQTGYGTEYTPMEEDKFKIGRCDLMDMLCKLEGSYAHLVVEDVEFKETT